MIKKLVTVAAASTFLMAAPLAFAQDATTTTTPPVENSGTAPAAGTTDPAATAPAGTTTTGAASSTTTTDSAEVAGTYLTEQSKDQISAEEYIGTTVYNASNESIGEINDLIIEKNGGVVAAVIGVGGFLGIGEKNVAVPMSNIMVAQNNDGTELKLSTSETSDTLKNAPEFKTLDDQVQTSSTPASTDPAATTTTTDPAATTTTDPAAPATGTAPAPAPAQ